MKKRLWVTLSSVSSLLVILLVLLGYQEEEGMVGANDAAGRRAQEEAEFNDGTWYDRKCREDEAKYRAEDKSPLHIFLGTEFGTYQHVGYDRFVRVREGFGPFGWIRSLGYRQYRVEGAQTYHVFNGPDKLVDLAQGLETVFSNVYGVVFSRTNAVDLVYGMTGISGSYDVSVLVRGPVAVTNVCEGATAYELRFSVANPNLEHDAKFDDLTRSVGTWRRAFAPIVISPETESDPAVWYYRPPLEPTTEELLMYAIKMKDQKLVPWFAGMPGVLTSARGNRHYSGCTEAEADEYSVDDKFFYRWCSEAEKDRLSELSTRPRRMRQRKPGEKRSHRSGYIDGRILAGDTVQWFDANRDLRKGTVVGKDEGGEYVEEFKCYVKTTHIEYMAKTCAWLSGRVIIEYGETSYLPWEFAYCLSDVIAKNGVKNDEQHYCASGAEGGRPGIWRKCRIRLSNGRKNAFQVTSLRSLKRKVKIRAGRRCGRIASRSLSRLRRPSDRHSLLSVFPAFKTWVGCRPATESWREVTPCADFLI